MPKVTKVKVQVRKLHGVEKSKVSKNDHDPT